MGLTKPKLTTPPLIKNSAGESRGEVNMKITGKNQFGIPENRIMKIDGRWIPIGNRKFKESVRKYKRRHNQRCPECGALRKNIQRHYRLYHKKFWEDTFIKPLEKAQIGELYGVRFIKTKHV